MRRFAPAASGCHRTTLQQQLSPAMTFKSIWTRHGGSAEGREWRSGKAPCGELSADVPSCSRLRSLVSIFHSVAIARFHLTQFHHFHQVFAVPRLGIFATFDLLLKAHRVRWCKRVTCAAGD